MLSRSDFLQVVRTAPLVSMDLLVRGPAGAVLLGLRRNRPAQDWWFVPGGIIRKNERFEAAFRRLTAAELGTEHRLSSARPLGAWEHLYDDNFAGDPGFGTHYVVLAWELRADLPITRLPGEQHRDYRWVSVAELAADASIHPNSRAYAGVLD